MSEPAAPADGADSPLVDAVQASPNHGPRLGRAAPDCLILHYTGMADGPSAIRWLCDPVSSVSCHYVVEETGRILQLVPEARRAWHAGRSLWAGEADINSASIGIEVVNGGHVGGLPAYPDAQIAAVIALCRDIVARHAIAAPRVLAHSDIAPVRKEDPGEHFPWDRLFAGGVGHWVPPHPASSGPCLQTGDTGPLVSALQTDLHAYGYGIAVSALYDVQTEAVVRAFQRHFRQDRVDGRADAGTRRTLADLISTRPA